MTSISYVTEQYLQKLRPRSLDDLVGQQRLTQRLKRLVRQVREQHQRFPPVVLLGDRYVGKVDIASALAHEIAGEQQGRVHLWQGHQLDSAPALEMMLQQVDRGDAVVVDQLDVMGAELRAGLVEAAKGASVSVGSSETGDSDIQISTPAFSLVGTARPHEFNDADERWNPLQVRDYNTEELVTLAHCCARRLDIKVTDSAAFRLARHSRGYARRLKSMLVEVLLGSVEMLSQKDEWRIEERMVKEVLE